MTWPHERRKTLPFARPRVDPGLPPHEISQTQKDEDRMVPYTWNLITFV